jgi:hypothetical protein
MKGNPAVPGGPLTSKPTRLATSRVPNRVGFFFGSSGKPQRPGLMKSPELRSLTMFAALANALTPVLADGTYFYWGGGGLGTIIVIVVIVLLLRR